MNFLTSQEHVDLKITSNLKDDTLIVDEITIDEMLHDLFDIRIIVHSSDINIDFKPLLGTNMTVCLDVHSEKRYYSGVVARFEQLHTTVLDKQKKLVAFYQIRLVPKLWLLTHTKDHRIFQNKSVQEIIKEVLNDAKLSDYTYKTQKGTQKKREYCVQYGESNYEFIARLCEEEGVFFHFEHEKNLHKLIFSDGTMIPSKIGGKAFPYAVRSPSRILMNHIYECFLSEQVTPTEMKIVDFNYEKPSVSLLGESTGEGIGGVFYDYPGLFQESSDGKSLAKTRLNALTWPGHAIQGTSTISSLLPYKSFKIENHPRKSMNAEYIVYRVRHKVSQSKLENDSSINAYDRIYENQFWAYPSKEQFVPTVKHPKNRIHSLQTAKVTGPSGEEIYTDKYGRIKVHFHWDTRGTKDEKSSCWIRVAQTWASSQWGGLVTPRIGMEVVVSFLDGDPDRPLVIGCVYNGEALPPYASKDPTKSTFKTSSSKGNKGNNELRFDDKANSEEIYVHAQKDMNIVIEHSKTEKIVKADKTITQIGDGTKFLTQIKDGDKILKITKGNEDVTLSKGDMKITLTKGDMKIGLTCGDQSINLTKGDMKITLTKGNQQVTLMNGDMKMSLMKGDMSVSLLKGDMKVTLASGNVNLKVNGNLDVAATGNISYKAAGKISMQGAQGISLQSPLNIDVKAGLMYNLDGPLGNIKAAGPLALKGAIIKLN